MMKDHEALCKVIDHLIDDSGFTETEAIMLVGQLLEEEGPNIAKLLESDSDMDQNMLMN